MNVNITTDELRLLAYFHEHATGFNDSHRWSHQQIPEIIAAIGTTEADFRKSLSYLKSFGLLGAKYINADTMNSSGAIIAGIWLTAEGENYMRQLEAELEKKQPGKFKKIGAKAVDLLEGTGMAVAIKVLTDFLEGRIPGHR